MAIPLALSLSLSLSLQVYVRRAYTAYEVLSVLQEDLAEDLIVLQWEFLLPQNHPNRQVSYRRASSTSLGGFIGKVSTILS